MIVIARRHTGQGEITILRSRSNGSHAYALGSWYQSHADRRGVSLAAYVHAIYGFVLQTAAERVLVIGCAGGTLGTMLARAGRQVDMVDIDPDAFVLARRFFNLAPEVECHVADGRAFLEQASGPFDAIVVDAFDRNTLPQHLCTVEFFRMARRRLDLRGTILFNAVVAHDLDRIADRIAAGMAAAGLPSRILDTPGERDRNAVIAGGNVGGLARPPVLVPTDALAHMLAAELEAMEFRDPRRVEPLRD